ncbi:hypothetical protein ACR6C2_02075 [Streptomyces sp. INA 01156]
MTESRKSEHAYHLDNTDPSLAPHLFETLKDVQGKCPVAWSDAGDGFWMLTKYADITAAANDWETYTVEEGHTIPSTGKSVMLPLAEVDPPLHTPWRRFLVPYFTPKTVAGYRPVIERIVEDAFSDLAARGTATSSSTSPARCPPPRSPRSSASTRTGTTSPTSSTSGWPPRATRSARAAPRPPSRPSSGRRSASAAGSPPRTCSAGSWRARSRARR